MSANIEIHGIPMDLGANLRGVDMGPTALRIAGLEGALESLGYKVTDNDEIEIKSRYGLEPQDPKARYKNAIARACGKIHDIALKSKERGSIPIFLGGDHSIAMGTVSGVAEYYRAKDQKIGLIWFDAHTDMNTPSTSPSGNIHGMPLAVLLGRGGDQLVEICGGGEAVDPSNVVIVGARQVDKREREIVSDTGVTVFSMKEIDSMGMAEVTRQALEIAGADTAGIHLSFDIDGLDPKVAPGVGTPVRGGIDFREAHLFMELLADSGNLVSMDIVELNPVFDIQNSTAETVIHLVQSVLGRRII